MAKLDEMRSGDWVRWESVDWEITDRTTYRESSDYQEVQWELEGSGGTRYLVQSRENKGGSVEEVWVCTRQAGIGQVQRPSPSGGWQNFREKDAMDGPPPKVKFDGLEFAFEGDTEGKAVDDDGNNVTKLTWDYYDASRRRNVAIEVWQCPDADYYEAYDGYVVKAADFTRIPPKARRGLKLKGDELASLVIACFCCLFFLPIVGGVMGALDTGAEYLVALLIPAFALFVSFLAGTHQALLAASAVSGIGAGIALVSLRGLGGSYWEYAAYGLAAGPAIAEVASRLMGGVRSSDKTFCAACASLLAMFIVSFEHYVSFAPRPHNPGVLLVACALPLLPAAVVFAFYFFKGGSDEPA